MVPDEGVQLGMTGDQQLIRGMLAGEERAFEAFFNAYFARVYRFALPRLNGDVEAAKDVVQATLGKAMRGLAGFRGDSGLFTWICRICRNEVVEYLRARNRGGHVVLMDDHPSFRAAVESIEAPEEFDLVKSYGRDEAARLVRAVLDRLPDSLPAARVTLRGRCALDRGPPGRGTSSESPQGSGGS